MNDQKKQTILTMKERVQIIKEYRSVLPKPRFQKLADKYNVSHNEIRGIIQNQEAILRACKERMDNLPVVEGKSCNILNLADRVKVIQEYTEKVPPPSFKSMAIKYNVSTSQITNILLNKGAIMKAYHETEKNNEGVVDVDTMDESMLKLRQVKIKFLDRVMYEYLQRALHCKESLNAEKVQKKAKEVADHIKIKNFRSNILWLIDFKKSYGIKDFTVESLRSVITSTDIKESTMDAVDLVRYVTDMDIKEMKKKFEKPGSSSNSDLLTGTSRPKIPRTYYGIRKKHPPKSNSDGNIGSQPNDDTQRETVQELRQRARLNDITDDEGMVMKIEMSPPRLSEDTRPIVKCETIGDEEISIDPRISGKGTTIAPSDSEYYSQVGDAFEQNAGHNMAMEIKVSPSHLIGYNTKPVVDDEDEGNNAAINMDNQKHLNSCSQRTEDQVAIKIEMPDEDDEPNLEQTASFPYFREHSPKKDLTNHCVDTVAIKIETPDENIQQTTQVNKFETTTVASSLQQETISLNGTISDHFVIKTEVSPDRSSEDHRHKYNFEDESLWTPKFEVVVKTEEAGYVDEPTVANDSICDKPNSASKSTVGHKRQRSSSPLPDIDTLEEALKHLKVVERFAVLKGNYRAVDLLTQLVEALKKYPK